MSVSTNRFLRKTLLLVTAMLSASVLYAQTGTVQGRVADETGAPVIGATVMVKGPTIATATDVDGRFHLKNVDENLILVVSHVGYQTQQVGTKGQQEVQIGLKSDAIGVESVEIVSVGYGTQKKESVVGAISTIKPTTLQVPVRSLSQMFAGNLAGVVALQNSGEPGKDDVAAALNVGRAVFFNRIKSQTGMTPNEFLRSARLRSAAELLAASNNLRVAEICYMLGFASAAYFAKCFAAQFGMLSTEFLEKYRKV